MTWSGASHGEKRSQGPIKASARVMPSLLELCSNTQADCKPTTQHTTSQLTYLYNIGDIFPDVLLPTSAAILGLSGQTLPIKLVSIPKLLGFLL